MIEKQIYYHDTDAGGVVYYANYLKYMEEARVDFFHKYGLSEISINGNPVFFPVRTCNITYHKPACYGETVRCDAVPVKISAARIVFHQRVTNTQTQDLLVEAEVTLACVDAKTFRPIRLPASLQAQIQVHQRE